MGAERDECSCSEMDLGFSLWCVNNSSIYCMGLLRWHSGLKSEKKCNLLKLGAAFISVHKHSAGAGYVQVRTTLKFHIAGAQKL